MEQKQSGASRVMAVLDVLGSADMSEHPHGMTTADISRLLGRERSVVSRQLRSLLDTGLVSRDPHGHYALSWRLFGLAVRAGDQMLTRAAGPLMFRLTALVRERSYLTVLSDGEVLTVHSESPHRPGEATGWAGRRVPVHCCASGMALLLDHDDEHIVDILRRGPDGIGPREARDYLARVQAGRRFGFTIADRIFDPELVGVGAAVRNRAGTIIAAVNLSGPATRVEPQMQVFAGRLLTMVRGLQHAIEPRARVSA